MIVAPSTLIRITCGLALAVALMIDAVPSRAGQDDPADFDTLMAQKASEGQVMILGSYHMANPGLDQFNLESDDVLSEKRQAEIKAVTEALARFNPTMIAVERRRSNAEAIAADYQAYVAGEAELDRNELHQIGFRLAHKLGHETVYAIDASYPFIAPEQQALQEVMGSSPRLQALMGQLNLYGQAAIAEMGKQLSTKSVGAFLRWFNDPKMIAANHELYLRFFMRMWHEENQGGAHTVGNWYMRNILIFQNILRLIEGREDERVLVIFGQGHVKILQDLVRDTPETELVDVLDYLPAE